MRFQQTGLEALMVTVEEEEHGSVAPREAVEEAGAILDNRTVLLLQDSSKSNNPPAPNVKPVGMDILQSNATVVANHAKHETIPVDYVLTGDDRTGAVERSVGKLWHSCCGILK